MRLVAFGASSHDWRPVCEQLQAIPDVEEIHVFEDDEGKITVEAFPSTCEALDAVLVVVHRISVTEPSLRC